MTTFTEDLHAGAFIASEAPGTLSRDAITVLSGETLKAGAVLGKVTVGAVSAAAVGSPAGNGAIGTWTSGAEAKPGDYILECIEPGTNAGKFSVTDPDGHALPVLTVGVAYAGPINGTLADGSADWASGDQIKVTVAAGTLKYKHYDDAATDGSEVAAGILFGAVDASAGDLPGVAILRNAEVALAKLVWDSGQDSTKQAHGIADLAKLNIIAR